MTTRVPRGQQRGPDHESSAPESFGDTASLSEPAEMPLAPLPVIAAFESKRHSERVRVAMREIKEGRRRTRSGPPPGRPRRVTPELATKVLELRARGLPWKLVAQHAGLPAGTCRKVRPPPQTTTGSVEKGPAEFGTSSAGSSSA